MDKEEIIKNIASRTGGDIYLGVVGAVRTGKSTFIKKVIEKTHHQHAFQSQTAFFPHGYHNQTFLILPAAFPLHPSWPPVLQTGILFSSLLHPRKPLQALQFP